MPEHPWLDVFLLAFLLGTAILMIGYLITFSFDKVHERLHLYVCRHRYHRWKRDGGCYDDPGDGLYGQLHAILERKTENMKRYEEMVVRRARR